VQPRRDRRFADPKVTGGFAGQGKHVHRNPRISVSRGTPAVAAMISRACHWASARSRWLISGPAVLDRTAAAATARRPGFPKKTTERLAWRATLYSVSGERVDESGDL
jgi:hypothetical protein